MDADVKQVFDSPGDAGRRLAAGSDALAGPNPVGWQQIADQLQQQNTVAGTGQFVTTLRGNSGAIAVTYGFAASPYGACMLARTRQGLCWLNIAPAANCLDELCNVWTSAKLRRDDAWAADTATRVFAAGAEREPLHLCGTRFQLQVWQVLSGIAAGNFVTYGQLAKALGKPRAARAVGAAVGQNPVAVVLPCHRVLPAGGGLGGYRWGPAVKAALLRAEA